jgi:crossover junction endodeoxyribonuclease RuvC
MIYIGIDPGLNGAIAIRDCSGRTMIHDMPTTSRQVGRTIKRQLDPAALTTCLAHDWITGTPQAILEQVTASPQMGVTSAFNFGLGYGAVLGVLAGLRVPVRFVRPQEWKAHFRLLKQPKDASRAVASAIDPQYAPLWHLHKHDGRAEAFLLAQFGIDTHGKGILT